MMEYYERFELLINDCVVKTPIAIASMAGIVDARYVLERADHIGAAFIGGYSIDEKTLEASREMVKLGRNEFLYDDPVEEIEGQIRQIRTTDVVPGVNLRGSSPGSYGEIAAALGDGLVYEIDAHCRQEPMIEAGCGEHLLTHPDELASTVAALKAEDACVSVKIRAGVSADDRLLARKIWKAGADILHVDLMDFGHQKVRQIRNTCPITIIANNSINSYDRMMSMFSHGADMVSLARRSDVRTLAGLDAAIARYADETGWYNSPKQLCRGGDVRALTFCCMPVKNCPLIPMLKKINLTPDEFLSLKKDAADGTPLSEPNSTCFGSLVWCCKISSPCMFRNLTLQQMGMTGHDYMRYKHRLAEKIMDHIHHDRHGDDAS